MEPVTLYRYRGSFHFTANGRAPDGAPEYRALPVKDFDALVRERDEARALLKEAREWVVMDRCSQAAESLRARIDTALREALAAGGGS